ncbi:MAG: caspase family protein [Myxococcaceae bacterium]|nr:caspase family protein [Myxococcaceae bacterium]
MVTLFLAAVIAAGPTAGPRRAVIVASNAPMEGRVALRYAHQDARAMADVLIRHGAFAAADVAVLLEPGPQAVLDALDAARAALATTPGDGLLVFYYSGHASQRALFPSGEALPLDALRSRLAGGDTGVRIGIIDACRGGGWTLAKGLTPTEPFEVGLPGLASEGTALLAASSGLEDAHETETLQGSFFTHHLVAGLRGAADTSADGHVTLSEAFAYANRLTIRDTASVSSVPQHPSFDLRLRGRQDVVLTSHGSSTTQLVLNQRVGPLEVVQLSTGLAVLESPAGQRTVRAAVPEGSYLVRRLTDGRVLSAEVLVRSGETASVDEASLKVVAAGVMPRKGPSSGLRGRHQVSVGAGFAPFDPALDAWTIGVPLSLAYSWFFHSAFAWTVFEGSLVITSPRPLPAEVRTAAMPATFVSSEWAASTSLRWEPTLLAHDTELRAGLAVGGGALGLVRGSAAHGTSLDRSVAPTVVVAADLLWMGVALLEHLGFGLKVSVSEQLGFASTGLVHLLSLNLAIVSTVGPAR